MRLFLGLIVGILSLTSTQPVWAAVDFKSIDSLANDVETYESYRKLEEAFHSADASDQIVIREIVLQKAKTIADSGDFSSKKAHNIGRLLASIYYPDRIETGEVLRKFLECDVEVTAGGVFHELSTRLLKSDTNKGRLAELMEKKNPSLYQAFIKQSGQQTLINALKQVKADPVDYLGRTLLANSIRDSLMITDMKTQLLALETLTWIIDGNVEGVITTEVLEALKRMSPASKSISAQKQSLLRKIEKGLPFPLADHETEVYHNFRLQLIETEKQIRSNNLNFKDPLSVLLLRVLVVRARESKRPDILSASTGVLEAVMKHASSEIKDLFSKEVTKYIAFSKEQKLSALQKRLEMILVNAEVDPCSVALGPLKKEPKDLN